MTALASPAVIRTDYERKPSPKRDWDWSAVTADYDGDRNDPIGYGATEEDVIRDLREQLDERAAS